MDDWPTLERRLYEVRSFIRRRDLEIKEASARAKKKSEDAALTSKIEEAAAKAALPRVLVPFKVEGKNVKIALTVHYGKQQTKLVETLTTRNTAAEILAGTRHLDSTATQVLVSDGTRFSRILAPSETPFDVSRALFPTMSEFGLKKVQVLIMKDPRAPKDPPKK
jgi:hypothetical protein